LQWLEILSRSAGVFLLTFFLVRIMGRRNVTSLHPFRLVNYGVIAVLAASLTLGRIENYWFGLFALAVWVLAPVAIEYLALRNKRFRDWIMGSGTVLIKDGKIMEENLRRERLSGEELLRELRKRNAFSLADVEFAAMETDGSLDVLLKSDRKPVTPRDLGQAVIPQAEVQTIILDGNILDEPLAAIGLSRGWLQTEITKAGIDVSNIFLGQADSAGDLYLDLFDDNLNVPQPKVRERVYASLEKCRTDLAGYTLATEDQEAKAMYAADADKLAAIIADLKPFLLR
jgi:uncharacterized membrane protein YcaP (DUF421 family)